MYRVYISGAVTGVADYRERFAKTENLLKKTMDEGTGVINPVRVTESMPFLTYEECLKLDMMLLGMADAVYFQENWKDSHGAGREYGYALAKGLDLFFENGNEDKLLGRS